jgi:AMIN domain/GAF domain
LTLRVEFDRNSNRQYLDLQVLLAIAYGVQLGRRGRIEALNVLTEQCVRATRASSAAIAIVRHNELHTLAYYGTLAQHLSLRAPLGESLVARCVRTGTPQIRYENPQSEIQSIIYWPLMGREGGRGVFALFERTPYAFTEDDLEVVARFVRGIHGVLEWQREAISPAQVQVNGESRIESSQAEKSSEDVSLQASLPLEVSATSAPILDAELSAKLIDSLSPAEESLSVAEDSLSPAEDSLSPVEESLSPAEVESLPEPDTSFGPEFASTEVESVSKVPRYAAVFLVILFAAIAFMYLTRWRQQTHPIDATSTAAAPIAATGPSAPIVSTTSAQATEPRVVVPAEPQAVLLEPVGIPGGKVTVEAIALRSDAGHDLVALRLSGQTEYKVARLSKPERIYIDFPKVASSRLTQRIPPASTVLGVRIGFEERRGMRIVLDLSQRADYLVVHSADGKKIVLTVSPLVRHE